MTSTIWKVYLQYYKLELIWKKSQPFHKQQPALRDMNPEKQYGDFSCGNVNV